MRLQINQERCMGCRICELVCGANDTSFNPARAKIKIREPLYSHPMVYVCHQCESPQCVEACPTDALYKTETVVAFDKEKCISCFLCSENCPYDAIFKYDEYPLKCDLCGGDPLCLTYCPSGVFRLVDGFYEGGD